MNKIKLFLSLSIIFLILLSSSSGAEQVSYLMAQPVVLEKTPEVISDAAYQYLTNQNKELVKIWVFFTDKKVFTPAEYTEQAKDVVISERALKRRVKMGLDKVVFADLPVPGEYIEAVVQQGGEHRRTSRWLNAASFEIPLNNINAVKDLPFIAVIKPMVGFKREYEAEQKASPSPYEGTLGADALNYGSSFGQLDQINVPEVHNKGYSGQGVTLAVFDTGYRKSHEAFAAHFNKNRVLGEWDFIFNDGNTANEAVDATGQWNHGTGTWGVAGGYKDGKIYGPAYKAYFLLAKTEDTRAEYQGEEDNWVAALEWADSLGADVVTSSLSYGREEGIEWYTYEQMDGQTAIITLAANTADSLGIVVCNSIGNNGPSDSTLGAPADAFDILSVGAVTSMRTIANFSSRGPTSDDRIKPEVCAQGANTYWVNASTDYSYGTANGTSLSCPLVAGAACLLLEARPNFTPEMIRTALMETASRASTPDNTYGWGIIDVNAALDWGANFEADTLIGEAPLTVNFTDLSTLTTPTWYWNFGDGETSEVQNPTHEFLNPGTYNVSLTIQSSYGEITNEKRSYIVALADTLKGGHVEGRVDSTVEVALDVTNIVPLNRLVIPIEYSGALGLKYTGYDTVGYRTGGFGSISFPNFNATLKRFVIDMEAGSAEPISAGTGTVIVLKFKIETAITPGDSNLIVSDGYDTFTPVFYYNLGNYQPQLVYGSVTYSGCCIDYTGNVDCSFEEAPDISDITRLIDFLYISHNPLCCLEEADVDASGGDPDISDITRLIDFLYISHEPLPDCP
ncbi:MAG: S8 family serine peptidase [candidate division Zixibacteria bacterium]|nr:S8 family serine peptidase [candidate division Zixibacteria bacterium]